MLWLLTLTVTGLLTLLDLDRTFYVPSAAAKRVVLWAWWWGFVAVNALAAVLLFFAFQKSSVRGDLNDWAYAMVVGVGYLALVRAKFATLSINGHDVLFGLEALYEGVRDFCYKRINAIARAARLEEVIALTASKSLAELARLARVHANADALLGDKEAVFKWLAEVLADSQSSEDDKKDTLAMFILSGDFEH